MSKSRLAVALGAAIVVQPSVTLAAAAATEIPPVVVSATRTAQNEVVTPASITVITRAQIEESGATHVVDVLRGQGAVQIHDLYGDGSRATVGLRGFAVTAGSNTLVLVDGRRLNNTDIGAPDLNSVALNDVERIEIIQGSAAVLYGDQAVGGVINIVTRAVESRRAAAALTLGSDDTRDVSVEASTRLANGFGVRASGQLRRSDNYRDHNDQDYRHASLLADFVHADGRVFAEYQVTDEELDLPGGLTPAQLADDRRQAKNGTDQSDTDTRVGRAGIRQALGDSWQLEAEVAYRDSDIDGELELFGEVNPFSQSREHASLTPRLVGSVPFLGDQALIIAGVDWDDIDYSLENSSSISLFRQESEQTLWAAYTQATVPLTARLTGTAGVRYAEMDNDFSEFSEFLGFVTTQDIDVDDEQTAWEVGLSFQATPAWRLFARYDTPFRFAKADEIAYVAPGNGPLDTQTGRSAEFGAEWQDGARRLKVLLYRLDVEDEIGFDPNVLGPFDDPGFPPPTGANTNLDDTRRDGLVVEGQWPLGTALLSGQYSYTDATFRSGPYDGNTMPLVAEHSARVALEVPIAGGWSAFGEAIYADDRLLEGDFDNNQPQLDERTVVNLTLRYARGPWSGDVRVTNVTDETYSDYGTYNIFSGDTYFPAPERRFFATVSYRLE